MHSSNNILPLLDTIDRFSIFKPNDTQLEQINDRKSFVKDKLFLLESRETIPSGRIVYRGQKRSKMQTKLVRDNSDSSEKTFYNHLFYFGDKARYFYESKDPHQGFKTVAAEEDPDMLFLRMRKEIPYIKRKHSDSFLNHQVFFRFFEEERNKSVFFNALNKNKVFYRYYNSFLHALGYRKYYLSHYLSSSSSLKIAYGFASSTKDYVPDNTDYLVLIYALPDPILNNYFSIPVFYNHYYFQKELESRLRQMNLPVFQGEWIHNKQMEYTLVGGMFPQLIWAVLDITHSKIIINPHMFEPHNPSASLWLAFDQSDFDQKIVAETNYRYGFSYNGNSFSPVKPDSNFNEKQS